MIFSPITGKPVLTQGFGGNVAHYKKYGLNGHNGVDLRATVGTPVYSAHEGYLRYEHNGNVGYGTAAFVTSMEYEPNKRRQTVYGHLSKTLSYPPGSFVAANTLIGYSGGQPGASGAGDSTAPHLHFGYRLLDTDSNVINAANGFNGFIDVSPYCQNWDKGNTLAPQP